MTKNRLGRELLFIFVIVEYSNFMVIVSGRSISGGHFSREIDGTRVTIRLMLMLSGAEMGVSISNTPEMLRWVIVEDIAAWDLQ